MLSQLQISLHVKYSFFLSDRNGTWIFTTVFLKILKHHIYTKSIEWEPRRSVRTDGRTDRLGVIIVALRNFANARKYRRF